jgi:hypothetical protein
MAMMTPEDHPIKDLYKHHHEKSGLFIRLNPMKFHEIPISSPLVQKKLTLITIKKKHN